MAADAGSKDTGAKDTRIWTLTGVVVVCAGLLGWFATDRAALFQKGIDDIRLTSKETLAVVSRMDVATARALAQQSAKNDVQDQRLDALGVQEASSRATITDIWGRVIRLEARGR